jgi:hypothetical protein
VANLIRDKLLRDAAEAAAAYDRARAGEDAWEAERLAGRA